MDGDEGSRGEKVKLMRLIIKLAQKKKVENSKQDNVHGCWEFSITYSQVTSPVDTVTVAL